MKREGILNKNILRIIGSMGHTDTIVICDAGLPVPKGVEKIDLAVVKGIPGFIDVLEAILKELVVEKVILAGEIKEDSPGMYKKVCDLVETIPVELVSHKEFKMAWVTSCWPLEPGL